MKNFQLPLRVRVLSDPLHIASPAGFETHGNRHQPPVWPHPSLDRRRPVPAFCSLCGSPVPGFITACRRDLASSCPVPTDPRSLRFVASHFPLPRAPCSRRTSSRQLALASRSFLGTACSVSLVRVAARADALLCALCFVAG